VQQVKSILLHSATTLSYEVVETAIRHNTEILFIDRKGFPSGRIWSHHFGSVSTIRKNQLRFSESEQGVEWIRQILIKKGQAQQLVLELLCLLTETTVTKFRDSIDRYIEKITNCPLGDRAEMFSTFRGWEGSMSRNYFEGLRSILPSSYYFERRSQRPALDMFNCLLNYSYGILYGLCESALIQAGVDPALGIMHRDEYNRPVLVYDFIEAYRHWADYTVCYLCVQEVIFEDFFDVENGQFWLNTAGKRILVQSFNDYLNEIVPVEGLSRSRQNHLQLDAQRLASLLKKFVS
jgi:CRISPR-associated protein Cas1